MSSTSLVDLSPSPCTSPKRNQRVARDSCCGRRRRDGHGRRQAIGLPAEARRRKRSPADSRKGRDPGRRPPQGSRGRGQGAGAPRKIPDRGAAQRVAAKAYSNASDISTSSRIMLEQRAEQLQKQEKMVENNQRKLSRKAGRRQPPAGRAGQPARRPAAGAPSNQRPEPRGGQATAAGASRPGVGPRARQPDPAARKKSWRQSVDAKAKEMLLTSIQRFAAAHTAEATTSTVDIPSDEMKGRIIGREGRNIRAFEKATGVDVIIDDTPGVVIVSAFDPVRREIARNSLNKLIADGRIHPSRIEELVAETQKEIDAANPPLRRGSGAGNADSRPERAGRQSARPAALSHELQPERAAAFDRSGVRGRHDRRGNGHERRSGPPRRLAARHRQGGRSRHGRRPPANRRRSAQALRRRRRKWSTPRSAITTTSAPTCRTRCSWRRPTRAAPRAPAPAAKRSTATSSGCRSWKRSPPASKASSRRSRSRPAARCASSPARE